MNEIVDKIETTFKTKDFMFKTLEQIQEMIKKRTKVRIAKGFLQTILNERELATCDKCKQYESTYTLGWTWNECYCKECFKKLPKKKQKELLEE